MRILGADLPTRPTEDDGALRTLVALDDDGRVETVRHVASLPEVAPAVAELAEGEVFLLGINVPLVVPAKAARARPVEGAIRRRFGFRLPPGGRAALDDTPDRVAGERVMAGLAAAGHPCLPYPDRDLRSSGLAETWPGLILKTLLWERSPLSGVADQGVREELFRAMMPADYRSPGRGRQKSGWAEQAVQLDGCLNALGSDSGYDTDATRQLLNRAASREDVQRAAGVLDATLIAGTARRYLSAPESCVFVGDPQTGYVIVPADGFVRRLAVSRAPEAHDRLFPRASLRERLGEGARLRAVDLLPVPGRPQRTEATFTDPPRYEFDNVDEMLWWKHCRHLAGATLPTEGLQELVVRLDAGDEEEARLRLVRSRHKTLSFRFEPPTAWRRNVPTRDGRTYGFQVLRATFDVVEA